MRRWIAVLGIVFLSSATATVPNVVGMTQSQAEAVPTPVAHWTLDESTGTIAHDAVGSHNGTLKGNPVWQPAGGKIAGALALDGSGDYVDTGYTENLTAWTLSVWVISPAGPSAGSASGPVHREQNYQINWDHPDAAWRGAAGLNVGGAWHPASFGPLVADTWYHLAASYDGQTLRAYKDGVPVTINDTPSGDPSPETASLKLGRHAQNSAYFRGTIDDVRIYNCVLTDEQISALFSGELGGPAKQYYVDCAARGTNDGSSWADAFEYLQDALTVATAGKAIWVAQGTYTPDRGQGLIQNDRTASFTLVNGVSIFGGFPSSGGTFQQRDPSRYETILSGNIGNSASHADNSLHVVVAVNCDVTTILDGLTISGGNANGANDPDNQGGGLFNDAASLTVRDCTFTGNSASTGGAIYGSNTGQLGLTSCMFIGNTATAQGGAIHIDAAQTMMAGCTFIDNAAGTTGGGMSICDGMAWVVNCTFAGNSAQTAGGVFNQAGESQLTGCVFTGNRATANGGGLSISNDTKPTYVTNCTFSRNSAASRGGGIYDTGSGSATLVNSILWANTATQGPQIALANGTTMTVQRCDVQDGQPRIYVSASTLTWGAGNVTSDPRFADVDGEDNKAGTADDHLDLSIGSPCIDAGDNKRVPADVPDVDDDGNITERVPRDVAGHARFMDIPASINVGVADLPQYAAIVDIGAFERQSYYDPKNEHIVVAQLNLWYYGPGCYGGFEAFNCNGKRNTNLIPYLGFTYYSADPQVIFQQIEWAADYGIDAFSLEWTTPRELGGLEPNIDDAFLKARNLAKIRWCIFYDFVLRLIGTPGLNLDLSGGINFDDRRVYDLLVSDFRHLANKYFDHPQHLRIDDRPVIYVYPSWNFKGNVTGAIRDARAAAAAFGHDVFIAGDLVGADRFEPGLVSLFDASTTFMPFFMGGLDATKYANVGEAVGDIDRVFTDWQSLIKGLHVAGRPNDDVMFQPAWAPQYDDRLFYAVHGEGGGRWVPAGSKEQVMAVAEVARKHAQPAGSKGKKIVWINTFNCWAETTTIEPTAASGPKYPAGNYQFDMLEVVREVFGDETYGAR